MPESIGYIKPNIMFPTDPDPAVAQQAWRELESRGAGWKLHLNFDSGDPTIVDNVQTELEKLRGEEKIAGFKIGKGGGEADGQPGKEATVYVGPKDKAMAAAEEIDGLIGHILKDPEGDVLKDDVPAKGKIWGRFDIGAMGSGFDPDFHQYGLGGIPFLVRDIDPYNKRPKAEAIVIADRLLRQRYGEYYTGRDKRPFWMSDIIRAT